MTTPPTPDKDIDPLVLFGHKLRDDAELLVTRYRITLVVLLACFAIAGWQAFKWHEAKLARLEAQASVEETRATNERALGEAWRGRAIALVDSVRHDTVRVRQVIQHTKVDTMWVPAEPAAPVDGVTYSGPAPLVPLPVVAKADFDSLGASCTRTAHDCASALAAKDSAAAHDSAQMVALATLNKNIAQQLTTTKRLSLVKEGGIAAFFYMLGRLVK